MKCNVHMGLIFILPVLLHRELQIKVLFRAGIVKYILICICFDDYILPHEKYSMEFSVMSKKRKRSNKQRKFK